MHLNGDEAMCFGSAFIASNSSASFKVRKIFLTQHPKHQISIEISPVNETKGEQVADAVKEFEDVGEGEK